MSPGGESGPGASARPSPARSRLLLPPLPHPHHEVELQPPEGNKEETPFSCISSAGPILLAVGPQSHRATLSPGRVCHQAACCLRRGQTADRGAGPRRVRAVPEFSPSLQGLGMQLVLGEKQGGEQRIHSAPPSGLGTSWGEGSHRPAPQHHVPGAPFWPPAPSRGDHVTHQSREHLSVIFPEGPKPSALIAWLCDLGWFMDPLCAFASPPVTWGEQQRLSPRGPGRAQGFTAT